MILQNDLLKYLNNLLTPEKFDDYCPNGLQIEGVREISKIAFAVSATLESIEKALEFSANALIVHHGLFWKFHGARPIVGPSGFRIKKIIKNDLNLFAYHLPLDGHLEIGNAASLAKLADITNLTPFGANKLGHMGVKGQFREATLVADFKKVLQEKLGHSVICSADDSLKIKTIGIITGGADNDWPLAKAMGLDAYLTGEMSEHHWHDSRESQVAMFAGGHHATEKFGIQNLMKKISQDFPKIETHFFDSPNPA